MDGKCAVLNNHNFKLNMFPFAECCECNIPVVYVRLMLGNAFMIEMMDLLKRPDSTSFISH